MNPEKVITILLKSAVGADDAMRAGKALGEGDTTRADASIYRAAKLALADTDACFTALERVILLTTIDETELHHTSGLTTSVLLHLDEEEHANLVARAGEQGMTSSTYLRWAALYATL